MPGLKQRVDALDERFVPVLAAALRSLVDGSARRRTRVGRRWEAARAALSDPRGGGFLRRLDDRYASSGPLGLLREVPQIGILLVAAVFLGGAGVALARSGPDADDRARQVQAAIADGVVPAVGPEPGVGVADHLAGSRARVASLNRADPDRRYTALVSFVAYAKVEDIADLVSEVDVRRVYVRARSAGPLSEVIPIAVDDLVPDTLEVYGALAKRKATDQEANLSQARSITSTAASELAFKAEFVQQAAVEGKEAAAFRTSCACVFNVLVEGTARDLADLLQTGGVRAVDVAVAGATPDQVEVRYFLPDDKGVVPERVRPVGLDYASGS